MVSEDAPEVRVRRYTVTPECDVIVFFRGQTMVLKCRDYGQAVKWAHIECKSYKIPDDFTVELVEAQSNYDSTGE